MPYTQFKKYSVQTFASNNNQWGAGGTTGDDLNTGCFSPIDYNMAGLSTFTLSNVNVSLTFTAGGGGDVSNCFYRFTGILTGNIVVQPAAGDATTYFNGFYFWENVTTGAFTVTVTTSAGSCVLPQGRRGCLFVDGTNGPRVVSMVGTSTTNPDPVPAGTQMLFTQASAPTGWTQVTTQNDYSLRIVSGAGGGTGGSVAFSTLFARTATDGYTLLTADTPSHTHFLINNINGTPSQNTSVTASNYINATAIGGGTDYQYGLQGSSSIATLGLTSATGGGGSHAHNIDMRVLYINTIQATRN
jgi:hypothetical protein